MFITSRKQIETKKFQCLFEDNFQLSSEAKNIFCVKTNYLYETKLYKIKGRVKEKINYNNMLYIIEPIGIIFERKKFLLQRDVKQSFYFWIAQLFLSFQLASLALESYL
jgi:hypothetical protein